MIARAFVELVAYMELARFDDPDEAQGAQEVVSRCLATASDEERSILASTALEIAHNLRNEGAPKSTIEFYEVFALRAKNATG